MAWREIGKKGVVVHASLIRCLASKPLPLLLLRHHHHHVPPEFSFTSSLSSSSSRSLYYNKPQFLRCFHATPQLLAKKKKEATPPDGKNETKGKFVKRIKQTQPPVEARYVAPKLKRTAIDKTVDIFEGMTVVELAKRTAHSVASLQDILLNVGEKVVSEFEPLTIDVAELVAMEAGVNVKRQHSNEGSEILPRPPVVTVMGHVDHGKTSILDALRQTSVAAREAGGITQHLGAFVVSMPSGASITFLDTPGHAAFSAMRARGAAVTDIVVLVVAADDGVMPQTLEAMAHAKSANVPVVVAINKCDKPSANPERVKIQLATEGLQLEDMGGDVQVIEVSALTKKGLDKLEEALLLQAELMDLKARIDGPAQAYVVEARLDKGRGPLVTAIVKAGTLIVGQHVVVGSHWGRIRAIRDTTGKSTDKAQPAMPVEIEGLKGLPMAGDDIIVVGNEERARMLSEGREKKFKKERLVKMSEEFVEETPENEEEEEEDEDEKKMKRFEMTLVVKGDVQGNVQAVTDALRTLNSPQVLVNVVHAGEGPVSESDVDLAQACSACIIGFNIKTPPSSVTQAATRAGIKIMMHRRIHHLLEDVDKLIVEQAPWIFKRIEMTIVVKGDVQGTVQAVTDALKTLNSPQVLVNVVHAGAGPILQSDVDLAQACSAVIVGFNVKTPPSSVTQAATRAGIKIMMHRVIYHLLEDVGKLIVERAPGTLETHVAGEAEVLSIFELKGRSKAKAEEDVKIAGCRVIDGHVKKLSKVRLLRSGEVVFEGSCVSLKREKQDVDRVGKGNECGLVIKGWDDFKVGDVIHCLEQVNRKPKFISSESGTVRIEC